jgi:hypothetical protein
MRRAISCLLFLAACAQAQQHQVAFTLGRLVAQNRLSGGTALQANYDFRFFHNDSVRLSVETHLLANTLRTVAFADPNASRDVASLFLTPGIRVTFAPKARLRPWLSAGGGYALYEQSERTQAGSLNAAPRFRHRGALQYGGGVDLVLKQWLSLRGDFRNFYTGAPALNSPGRGGGLHNPVISGGFVLNFGE